MSMCMLFVFGALIEYAFVNVMVRKSRQDSSRYKKSDDPSDIKDDKVWWLMYVTENVSSVCFTMLEAFNLANPLQSRKRKSLITK